MLDGAAAAFLRLLGGSLCGASHLAPEEEEEEGRVGGLPQRRLESQARAEAAAKKGTIIGPLGGGEAAGMTVLLKHPDAKLPRTP